MSESNETTQQSTQQGSQQFSSPDGGEGFGKAEELLTVDNQDSGDRSRNAFSSIENRGAADEQTYDAESLKRRVIDDQRTKKDASGATAAENLNKDLEEKALEEGVEAANDTSRTVMDMTPHNM